MSLSSLGFSSFFIFTFTLFVHRRGKTFGLVEADSPPETKTTDAFSLVASVQAGKKTEYLLSVLHLLRCVPWLVSQGRYGAALYNGKKALAVVTKLAETPSSMSDDKAERNQTLIRLSQWTLCQLLVDSLCVLGEVSELCGNVPAAEYYYSQGVEFGETCGSAFSLASFLASLADFELKRDRKDEAGKHLKRLETLKVPHRHRPEIASETQLQRLPALPPVEYNRGSADQLGKYFLDKAQTDSMESDQRALYFGNLPFFRFASVLVITSFLSFQKHCRMAFVVADRCQPPSP